MGFFNFFKQTKGTSRQVFLDYASTTPVDYRVMKEMMAYEVNHFANPSALYSEAIKSKDFLNKSRQKIADILNTQKKSIVFTSGGTEGNNLALLGIFEAFKSENFTPHFIVSTIEHPAILEVCNEIERRGGKVTKIPVNVDGLVNPNDIKNALTNETVLVSVMYANNEIGTVQPIKEISRIIKDYRNKNNNATDREGGSTEPRTANVPYFHTDACQAPLYLPLDVLKLGVDLMTLDGIKIYGPRGFGVLYIKEGVKILPTQFGGGHENGLRSGTENVSGAIGFSLALQIAQSEREKESERLKVIRDYGIDEILKNFKGSTLNGSRENRLPNNINICFPACAGRPGIDAEFAVISLDVLGISASYSSSCRNLKEDSSSYVVLALGKDGCKESSLRFTLGRGSKKIDIDDLIKALKNIIK